MRLFSHTEARNESFTILRLPDSVAASDEDEEG
jgi:hypothetical protein